MPQSLLLLFAPDDGLDSFGQDPVSEGEVSDCPALQETLVNVLLGQRGQTALVSECFVQVTVSRHYLAVRFVVVLLFVFGRLHVEVQCVQVQVCVRLQLRNVVRVLLLFSILSSPGILLPCLQEGCSNLFSRSNLHSKSL